MMRYNKRSTIYASFGLVVMGMALVLLNGVVNLVPEDVHLLPDWLPRRVFRGVVTLIIALDIFGIMLAWAYVFLQALARMEAENLQIQAESAAMKSDIRALAVTVRSILDRESDRHGPAPPAT